MSQSPILVTGAAGFIGMHVTRRLLETGRAVIGLDNLNAYYDPRLKQARLTQLAGFADFQFEKIDIADATRWQSCSPITASGRWCTLPRRRASAIRWSIRTLMSTPIWSGL